MLKREWKPWYPKHRGPVEPDRTILEMAVARELLATWAVIKDKALVDRHLAAVEKRYGAGAEQRVRDHMRQMVKIERHT
jgi:hypothetical protein